MAGRLQRTSRHAEEGDRTNISRSKPTHKPSQHAEATTQQHQTRLQTIHLKTHAQQDQFESHNRHSTTNQSRATDANSNPTSTAPSNRPSIASFKSDPNEETKGSFLTSLLNLG